MKLKRVWGSRGWETHAFIYIIAELMTIALFAFIFLSFIILQTNILIYIFSSGSIKVSIELLTPEIIIILLLPIVLSFPTFATFIKLRRVQREKKI